MKQRCERVRVNTVRGNPRESTHISVVSFTISTRTRYRFGVLNLTDARSNISGDGNKVVWFPHLVAQGALQRLHMHVISLGVGDLTPKSPECGALRVGAYDDLDVLRDL